MIHFILFVSTRIYIYIVSVTYFVKWLGIKFYYINKLKDWFVNMIKIFESG